MEIQPTKWEGNNNFIIILERVVLVALKFSTKKRKVDIEWKDGAILKFHFPLAKKIAFALADKTKNPEVVGLEELEKSLIGWEGLIDEDTGKPIPFNDEMREEVFDVIIKDEELQKKVIKAFGGPLPNLPGGSTPN